MRTSASLTLLLILFATPGVAEVPSTLQEIRDRGFEVVTTSGETVLFSSLVEPDRAVVIEFWATWCAPCHKTLPRLVELQRRYGDALVVLGLTVEDPVTDAAKVQRFVEEHGLDFRIAFAPPELFRFMNDRSDIAVPKLFVFDDRGGLVEYLPRYSPLTGVKLRSAVARAVPR